MAHEVKWLIENHLILNTYSGTLEMTDFFGVAEKNIELMTSTQNRIHIIADLTDLESVHPKLGHLSELVSITRTFMGQPNLGTLVAHGTDNKFIKFLGTMIMQLNKTEWRVFPTFEEVIRHLIHVDPSLKSQLEASLPMVTDDSSG